MKKPLVDVSVLIIFFNRPNLLEQVFEQVKIARPSRLFLYQDGPRNAKDSEGIVACRKIVENIDWECEVQTKYQEKNFGCDPSEYIAQTWAFSMSDKCIVLEDDCVPALSFFTFCKELLDKYEYDERIGMICGTNYEEISSNCIDDYFFTSFCQISGWASWKRVIDTWDEKMSFLDNKYYSTLLEKYIKDTKYRKETLKIFRDHKASNKAHYESILTASMILNSGLCIVPSCNMINNIGTTEESTHFAGVSLKTLPRGYRKIFTMKRFEKEFPLKHPEYIIEKTSYRNSVYNTQAWDRPYVKIFRSIEELCLNIKYGNFSRIFKAFGNRINIWLGRRKY